jgi:uncharacterized radical SAM superfamily Fe-S cluster-containing enzyme
MDKSKNIKDDLRILIEKIDNDELLEMVYQILDSKRSEQDEDLINNLTVEERKELYQSYDESLDDSNLIDLDAIKEKHSKWREK